jgi:hypothetical protein
MAKNTSTIDVKIAGLKELKQQLKELESQLATASDPKQMQDLSAEAGNLRSEIKAANTQLEVMSSTDPFKKASNSFGIMSEQLASLDFKGAANSANLFANSVKGITPEALGGKLKGLGSAVLSLGKAFMSVGASLLVNPIFLIAAAIVAIVVIIGVLLNKLGLLKPILNAIGKAFEFVMSVIDAVVQSIKDFLDWLGLTSFAAEEAAERQAAAQEKVAKAFEDKRNKVVSAYDHEIALAQIAGESTVDLERKKQLAIIETSRAQYRALEAQRDALKAAGVLTAEQSKSINEQMRTLREGIEGARKQIELINKKEVVDNKKKNEEVIKSDRESYKKRIEEQKKYNQDRLTALRLTRDLELELLEDGIDKDLKLNKERYKRLIEDTRASETLNAAEKQKIVEELFLLESRYANDIAQKYVDIEKEKQNKITESLVQSQEVRAQLEEDFFEIYRQNTTSAEQLEIDAVNEKYFQLIELAKQYNLDITELEKRQKAELEIINEKSRQKEIEKQKNKTAALLELEQALYDSTAAIGQIFINDSKKLEQFQKAQTLIQIGIDTAKAISGLTASSNQNPANGVTAGLAGAVQFATGLARILTNVAKAKQLLKSPSASVSGGGGGGAAASSSSTSTQAMQPSFSLFGQANQGNNASSSQSVEQSNSMTIFAKVSAVDMTAEQASNQKNMQMATL